VAVLARFLERLPVHPLAARADARRLDATATRRIQRVERVLMGVAALLAAIGFLGYYLPVYWAPQLFPSATVTMPVIGTVQVPWAELLWTVVLTTIEIFLLTLLNVVGVHEIAVATGFLTPESRRDRTGAVLAIGLQEKTTDVLRYGIDPFEGLRPWMLFVFNAMMRLKGWLANKAIRYLVRLLLGRYAVRALLDFAGVPVYMAINAYATYAVLREAKVVLMGPDAIRHLVQRVAARTPAAAERALLYDTLQYIAVSKRDFHRNHYLLTKDYLERLAAGPPPVRAVCRAIILSGFVLDGQLSWRERRRLSALNRLGVVHDGPADVRRQLRRFLQGGGLPLDGLPG
jgi:hypothetical protein